jgi:AcrR family transcriptional regulator
MGTAQDSERTRAKLINAAGELFAERGFHGVTVRDIVKRAGTHLSALNYHFKDKETLYREVLRHACQSLEVWGEEERATLFKLKPEAGLIEVVKSLIAEYGSENARSWQARLIDRECLEPSAAFREVAKMHLEPEFQFITEVVGRVVRKPAESPEVRFAAIGLYAQVSTVMLYRDMIEAVAPGLSKLAGQREWLARELARITIAAAKAPAPEETA